MKLLQVHFGTDTQKCRYTQELRLVKWKPGQSIQDLHDEAVYLQNMVYPGWQDEEVEADAVECFINAFPSKSMQTTLRQELADSYGGYDCCLYYRVLS